MAKRHHIAKSATSVIARIEEIVLASSGADALELVFALVLARIAAKAKAPRRRVELLRAIEAGARRWPELEAKIAIDVADDVLAEVLALLDVAIPDGGVRWDALDAVFEQLASRVGKGAKGQFFTPRSLVEFAVGALALKSRERVVDPACGSGAFLAHARAHAKVLTRGYDVDARAVRIARLLAIATGSDPSRIERVDALAHDARLEEADVIATNPPFAGGIRTDGFDLARFYPRAERDALFVERCLSILRKNGRIAIVLPHNKIAARGWSKLRAWLVQRARIFAVISLPRETFAPHTSQRTALVFAKKRSRLVSLEAADVRAERVFMAVSERAGKDAAGEPIVRADAAHSPIGAIDWRAWDHDLDDLAAPLARFLGDEGFSR